MARKKAPAPKPAPTSAQIRKAFWKDGCEVADAERDLAVFIRPEDLIGAIPKDPMHCIFTNSFQRLFGSDAARICVMKTVAYVELPGAPTINGKRRVERFILGADARHLVEDFDRGLKTIPEAAFMLLKPPPYRTIGFEREKLKQRRPSFNGANKGGKGKRVGRTEAKPIMKDTSVRNGSGKIHLTHIYV